MKEIGKQIEQNNFMIQYPQSKDIIESKLKQDSSNALTYEDQLTREKEMKE